MKAYNSKEEAQNVADQIIASRDWETNSISVYKAYEPIHGVNGWILIDAWNKPL